MTETLDATPRTPLRHLPGNFYYADLHTSDVDAARSFYGALFGWNATEVPGAPMRYVLADVDGRLKAGITGLTEQERGGGATPYWASHLTVADLDAAMARARELGGRVLYGPTTVFDRGRMAVIEDPTGGRLVFWQDIDPNVTSVLDEHGSPFWHELHSSDADAAIDFYSQIVGWTRQDNDMGGGLIYTVMETPGPDHLFQSSTAAIMPLMESEREAGTSSYWAVIFHVDDPDATVAQARELGAGVVMEPFDIPGGVGRLAWLSDPQGGIFCVMKPVPVQPGTA